MLMVLQILLLPWQRGYLCITDTCCAVLPLPPCC